MQYAHPWQSALAFKRCFQTLSGRGRCGGRAGDGFLAPEYLDPYTESCVLMVVFVNLVIYHSLHADVISQLLFDM